MTTHKYAQMQSKAKRDITREMDGEKNTFIRFRSILWTREDNLQFVEKPADEDARTRQQKRHYYRHEVTKTMEAKKVTKDRKSTKQKVEATEVNITTALEDWHDADRDGRGEAPPKRKHGVGMAQAAVRKRAGSYSRRTKSTHSMRDSRAGLSPSTWKSSSMGRMDSPLWVSSTSFKASTTVVLPESFSPTSAFSPLWNRTSRPDFPYIDLN